MTTAAQPLATTIVSPRIATLDITVLMGGPSNEREVSLESGRAVADALERMGHRVHRADISPDDLSALVEPADLIFVALHGAFGEDGQLQSILNDRKIPFVGSGPAASHLAMNKVDAKIKFVEAGLPTPRFEVVTRDEIVQIARFWQLPAVLKPINGGSSVGTTIEKNPDGLRKTLSTLIERYGCCMIEEYIPGPEFTVGVLGETALPICEIRTPREFYDYTAKYHSDDTEYCMDTDLSCTAVADLQAMSLKAHRALGCRDFSRVDWMIDARNNHPFILEVNTIPGFTAHSLLPKAAAWMGIGFDELCQRIVELALTRETCN